MRNKMKGLSRWQFSTNNARSTHIARTLGTEQALWFKKGRRKKWSGNATSLVLSPAKLQCTEETALKPMLFHLNDFSARFSDFHTRLFFHPAAGNSFCVPPACHHHHHHDYGRPTVNDDTRNNEIDSTNTVSSNVVRAWILLLLLLSMTTDYYKIPIKIWMWQMCLVCVKITYCSIKGDEKTYLHANVKWAQKLQRHCEPRRRNNIFPYFIYNWRQSDQWVNCARPTMFQCVCVCVRSSFCGRLNSVFSDCF